MNIILAWFIIIIYGTIGGVWIGLTLGDIITNIINKQNTPKNKYKTKQKQPITSKNK